MTWRAAATQKSDTVAKSFKDIVINYNYPGAPRRTVKRFIIGSSIRFPVLRFLINNNNNNDCVEYP